MIIKHIDPLYIVYRYTERHTLEFARFNVNDAEQEYPVFGSLAHATQYLLKYGDHEADYVVTPWKGQSA